MGDYSWIVTLDVLKLYVGSNTASCTASWIVTLDVLKFWKMKLCSIWKNSWIVTLDVLKSIMYLHFGLVVVVE